jgi:predicted dehydrogenase
MTKTTRHPQVPTLSRRAALGLGVGAGVTLLGCSRGEKNKKVAAGPRSTAGLGVAVIGLGFVAGTKIIPALARTSNCHLAGLVSSSESKLDEWGTKHGVAPAGRYTYDTFERIADNPDIDLVYIALPNALHAEYAIRAAQAGKHVFVEKPMAVSVAECDAMMAASASAGRQLGVAYRCHYSAAHQEMMRMSREQTYGAARLITAKIGFPVANKESWHYQNSLAGGGVLLEQGIYAIQAARYISQEEPIAVMGLASHASDAEGIEDTVLWNMSFASGAMASCATSYVTAMDQIWVGAERGFYQLARAFSYKDRAILTSAGDVEIDEADEDEFVGQLDAFAGSIQAGTAPPQRLSAAEGRTDIRIVSATYESIREGRTVKLV